MHGFLKIDGVEDFDSIVFFLQELSAFDENAALVNHFLGQNAPNHAFI